MCIKVKVFYSPEAAAITIGEGIHHKTIDIIKWIEMK
jgi:hypothetical protein